MEGGFWRRLLRAVKSMQRRSGFAKVHNLSFGVGDSLGSKKVLQELRRGACVWILGVKYEFPVIDEEWTANCGESSSEIDPENDKSDQGISHEAGCEPGDVDNTEQAWAEVCEKLFWDVKSRVWIMYRQHFEPLGKKGMESDVGWGCTLRSGQMMLAQTLCFLRLGRDWRLHHMQSQETRNQSKYEDEMMPNFTQEVLEILEMFFDSSNDQSVFSLHQIFERTAQAPTSYGRPGQWLGPAAVSQLLAEALNSCRDLGMRGCVLSDMGGGAPTLSSKALDHHASEQNVQTVERSACEKAGTDGGAFTPLLVFIPLVLGIDELNKAYVPQLQAVLTWKWTVGIVGGTGGSSVYVVGTSHTGAPIIMDPHTVKKAAVGYEDLTSFFGADARILDWMELDPSLCLGFLCQQRDDLDQFCKCFLDLQEEFSHAPLVYVCEDQALETDHKSQMHPSAMSMPFDGSPPNLPIAAEDEEWQLL